MAIFVTTGGYFGGFAVRPKKVKGYGPNGDAIFTTPIRITITRLGVAKDTKEAIGMFDTEHLPFRTIEACKDVYGEDKWQESLIQEIEGLRLSLRMLKKGEAMPELDPVLGRGPRIVAGMRTIAVTGKGGTRPVPKAPAGDK